MNELKGRLETYKKWLRETQNRDEIYKWEAVKQFQDSWNPDASDFKAMLTKAISKSSNLLFMNSKGFILNAAKYFPEETKAMFLELFDEKKDLAARMRSFSESSNVICEKLRDRLNKRMSPQQDERTMAFYLSMKYPDVHYLYKDSYYRKTCSELKMAPAKAGEKYVHFMGLAENLKKEYVLGDADLVKLHHESLNENCWKGNGSNLILQNFLYRSFDIFDPTPKIQIIGDETWWIYAPGEGARFWDAYSDEDIIGLGWSDLGDLMKYPDREAIADSMRKTYNQPGKSYKNNSLACWEFSRVMKKGDIVIPKRGLSEYLGCGIVESDYRYEPERGEYPQIRSIRWIKKGKWIDEDSDIVQKTLTNVTKYGDYIAKLKAMILDGEMLRANAEGPAPMRSKKAKNLILYGPPGTGKTWSTVDYGLSFLEGRDVDTYEAESRNSKSARFRNAMESGHIKFISFHQSYSYEEFVEGIRPKVVPGQGIAYELEDGVFKALCQEARNDAESPYVLIIDEINRGNVSKILGELITLIEEDKRERAPNALSVILPYSKKDFSVPANVYIIGTMNTADRSVESLDTALRRRFSFVEMMPDPSLLSESDQSIEGVDLNSLLGCINRRLERLIDRDHQIGHSYFMGLQEADDPIDALKVVFQNAVMPLLKEYFYADPAKIGLVLGKAFVEIADGDTFAFAPFDSGEEGRYADRREFRFIPMNEWSIDSFRSVYEPSED